MKSRSKKIALAVILTAAMLIVWAVIYDRAGVLETGLRGNELYIINYGTGSSGSAADCIIDREGVVSELEAYREYKYRGFWNRLSSSEMQFGWRFGALSEGECSILVRFHRGGEIDHMDIFHVSVDKDKNLSYDSERTEVIKGLYAQTTDYKFSGIDRVELGDGGKEYNIVSEQGIAEFGDLVRRTFGTNERCDKPDTDKLIKMRLILEYRNAYGEEPRPDRPADLYFDENGGIYSFVRYDGWYCFTPDEYCDVRLKDEAVKISEGEKGMKLEPKYCENLAAYIKYKNSYSIYVTDRNIWYLDLAKRYEVIKRKCEEQGYTEARFEYEVGSFEYFCGSRFGIAVVDTDTADRFLGKLMPYEAEVSELKELYEKGDRDVRIYDLYPRILVDMDSKTFYSCCPEPFEFEEYVPDGWKGIYKDFSELIPENMRYW